MIPNRATFRVLVADDSVEVAGRIVAALREELDVEILGPAHDGAEALALFRRAGADLIILDFDMPRMTGLDVLRNIRASGSHVIIIIVTAHHDNSIEAACLQAGANHFLNKFEDLHRLPQVVADYTG